jgi:hypothetical protein
MEDLQESTVIIPRETEMPKKTRPAFLLVLCILSFVGIGFVFFSGLFSFVSHSTTHSLQFLQDSRNPFGNLIENQDEFIATANINNIVGIIAALVCLAGVLLMWNLKKAGFYVYSVAEIVPPVVALALSGHAGYGSSPIMVMVNMGLVFALLIAIAFIIMYAVNLKHMN